MIKEALSKITEEKGPLKNLHGMLEIIFDNGYMKINRKKVIIR